MQFGKVSWYLTNLRNLIIASLRTLVYCIFHPKEFAKLFFLFFSTLNEFYQVSHGRLRNFEDTTLFQRVKKDNIFCRSNVFNMEAIVTRPNETQILATLTCELEPKTIFEIGTYNGFTTLHFAYNSSADSKIYTLDLPPDFEVTDKIHYSYDDLLVVELSKKNIARRVYKNDPMGRKIIELFGDSEKFDYSPYYGKIDMVFIDGNHSYPYVKSDTENAFKMLSDQGVIIWHDFDYIIHRDVFKYLNRLSEEYKIYSIPHTRFAIYGKKL
jgi:predicted O-methyltransferase YrrM